MSVYTTVAAAELKQWLSHYDVGGLVSMQPIAAGIENTNYFVDTEEGSFVLTLFERIPVDELPFYLELQFFLAGRQLPVPMPERNHEGNTFLLLNGKPAALIERIRGEQQLSPSRSQCAAIGSTLARLHLAVADFAIEHSNARGAAWRQSAAEAVMPFLNNEQRQMLRDELQVQHGQPLANLPRGAVHADLFRDNVLFRDPQQDEIVGIIDFGFAATDAFIYDLAIVVNDWCIADKQTGALDQTRVKALLAAYQSVRQPTAAEIAVWPLMLRCAALRFWLSRLYDFYLPRPGDLVHAHDPAHFERILIKRRADAADNHWVEL